MQVEIESIGIVRSPQTEAVDEGWGALESEIHLEQKWSSGLQGMEGFTHVWILTWLHEAKFVKEKHLARHPRENPDFPLVGIFAQRARHRPNRIGMTACPIVSNHPSEGILRVKGLDAIDGTPVLDIKPYVGVYDKRDGDIPDWMKTIMEGYF